VRQPFKSADTFCHQHLLVVDQQQLGSSQANIVSMNDKARKELLVKSTQEQSVWSNMGWEKSQLALLLLLLLLFLVVRNHSCLAFK
jgi:hypothetical protein